MPILILSGARDTAKAWASVLTAMKSTPSSPEAIIVFTALQPAPPTPMTLIFASETLVSSSSKNMRASLLQKS